MVKQTLMHISPMTNVGHPVIQHLLERYAILQTPSLSNFYDSHIAKYNKSRDRKLKFCGGLDDIIKTLSDVANCITLVTIEEEVDSTIVYSLLVFNTNYTQYDDRTNVRVTDIYIELLCGNQMLPPSGEASVLLRILENACFETGNYVIMLESTPRSEQYYKDHGYHEENIFGDTYLIKNLRALANWRKARSYLPESSIRQIDLKRETIKQKQKAERISKIGRGTQRKKRMRKKKVGRRIY